MSRLLLDKASVIFACELQHAAQYCVHDFWVLLGKVSYTKLREHPCMHMPVEAVQHTRVHHTRAIMLNSALSPDVCPLFDEGQDRHRHTHAEVCWQARMF